MSLTEVESRRAGLSPLQDRITCRAMYRVDPGTVAQQEHRIRKSVIHYLFLWFNECLFFFLYLTNTSIYDHCLNNIMPGKLDI